MGHEYDTRTTRIEVDGDCPGCGSNELTYSRNVTREHQLHITCEDCGTTIKSKTDPAGLTANAGVEYEDIVQKVTVQEFDLQAMFQLDDVAAGNSSVTIEHEQGT
jgi:ribosomal protein S27E